MKTSPRLIVMLFAFLFASNSFADADTLLEGLIRRQLEEASICLVKGHVAEGDLVLRLGSLSLGVVKSVSGKERALVQYAPFDSVKSQYEEKQQHLAKTVYKSMGLVAGDVAEVKGFDSPAKITHLFEDGHAIIEALDSKGAKAHFLIHADDVKSLQYRAYTRGISAKTVALFNGWTGFYAVDVLSVDPVAKTATVSYVANEGADPFVAKLSSLYPRSEGTRSGLNEGDEVSESNKIKIGRVHFIFDNGVMKIANDNPNYVDRKIWEVQKAN